MIWLQALGWFGSALLVVSLLQAGMLRLRWLNLTASVILVGYNAALGVWPMVVMNAAVCIIDLVHIRALSKREAGARAFRAPGVAESPTGEYLAKRNAPRL
ncbi:hypothetical protein ACPPVQ_13530 [Diaminobutyricibacter sp. McL0618]|uniref:hypothetical protein n=1 Tax=Leifsonia sp. McL0618 TaxID=3415677 RepID=UPI003CE989B9